MLTKIQHNYKKTKDELKCCTKTHGSCNCKRHNANIYNNLKQNFNNHNLKEIYFQSFKKDKNCLNYALPTPFVGKIERENTQKIKNLERDFQINKFLTTRRAWNDFDKFINVKKFF